MEDIAGDIRSFAAIGVHEPAQHVEGGFRCCLCVSVVAATGLTSRAD
jgi:hypothetical protein